MQKGPFCGCILATETLRLVDYAGIVQEPDRHMEPISEIHRTGSPEIIVIHNTLAIFRRLDDGVDSYVAKVVFVITNGVEFAVKVQFGISDPGGCRMMPVQIFKQQHERQAIFVSSPK